MGISDSYQYHQDPLLNLNRSIVIQHAMATVLAETNLDPTPTVDADDAFLYQVKAAPTAGISPKSTHPPGWGGRSNWKAVELSKKMANVLGYGLIFPVLLCAFTCWCILAPMSYYVLKPKYMMAQWARGCQQRARHVAIINEEVARDKAERAEERSGKKLRQAAEIHIALSNVHDKVVEKPVFLEAL